MQVEPVAFIGKMEGAEGEDGFFGGDMEEQTIAFAVAFGKRFGLYAEEHTGLSLAVHIVGGQLGILVTYLTGEGGAEDELRIGGTVLHATLQNHLTAVLGDAEEDGVELQRIDTQTVDGGAAVDASPR